MNYVYSWKMFLGKATMIWFGHWASPENVPVGGLNWGEVGLPQMKSLNLTKLYDCDECAGVDINSPNTEIPMRQMKD